MPEPRYELHHDRLMGLYEIRKVEHVGVFNTREEARQFMVRLSEQRRRRSSVSQATDPLLPPSERVPLPVFPWSDGQVQEVDTALDELLDRQGGAATTEDLARAALTAAARVMHLESRPDPMGAPRGYGWREIRGTTNWFTVAPNGTWQP